MDNITLTAKAVRFKTVYRRNADGDITSTTRLVKMISEDGARFEATIKNPDPLFQLGRNKTAHFELDFDPRDTYFGDRAEIVAIRTQ